MKPAPRHKLGDTLGLGCPSPTSSVYGIMNAGLVARPKYFSWTSANIWPVSTVSDVPFGYHIFGSEPDRSSIVSTWPSKKPTLKRKWPPLAALTFPPCRAHSKRVSSPVMAFPAARPRCHELVNLVGP